MNSKVDYLQLGLLNRIKLNMAVVELDYLPPPLLLDRRMYKYILPLYERERSRICNIHFKSVLYVD